MYKRPFTSNKRPPFKTVLKETSYPAKVNYPSWLYIISTSCCSCKLLIFLSLHTIRKASKGTFWLWWNPSFSLAWIPLDLLRMKYCWLQAFSHGWVKAHEKRKHKPFDAWKQKQMCSEKAFIKMTLKHIHIHMYITKGFFLYNEGKLELELLLSPQMCKKITS